MQAALAVSPKYLGELPALVGVLGGREAAFVSAPSAERRKARRTMLGHNTVRNRFTMVYLRPHSECSSQT